MISESHYHILVLLATFVCLGYIRLARAITYAGGIPRVGGSGIIGYIATALRWTLDAPSVIMEGKMHYPGRPFVIPTLASVFVIFPTRIESSYTPTSLAPCSFSGPSILTQFGRVMTTS
jgi:hypothetical protein